MGFTFEFNPRKAASNLKKHDVAFTEAMTVFDDPLSQTFADVMHSDEEYRLITIGLSSRQRLLFVSHLEEESLIRLIGARQPTTPNVKLMKNSAAVHDVDTDNADPLSPRPLDLATAVRGKYYGRIQKEDNVILLAPDLMDTFPDSDSVNEALRGLKAIATRSVRRV